MKSLPSPLDLDSAVPRTQYAALPYRTKPEPAIMLVSSRETQRWVVPKGWPIKDLKPHLAAAREALEEAGLVGIAAKTAIGTYQYGKRLSDGTVVPCEVQVFPFEVTKQKKKWPEKDERTTRWFTPDEAASAVDESDLADLIRSFGATLAKS